MRAAEAVLLALYANGEMEAGGGGRMPVGRAALQRLVYLVSLVVDVDARFYSHYYGPHSQGVDEGLGRLWRHGCVLESSTGTATGRPALAYSLTVGGERLGKSVAGDVGRGDHARIRAVVRECRDSCGLRDGQMAHAAKAHYMKLHNGRPGARAAEIVEMGQGAGWTMGAGDAGFGLGLLERLGLGDAAADSPRMEG